MGMRPVGRDCIGVPSQVAPSGRCVEGGSSHPTLHTRRRFAPRAAASRLSDYPLRFARVCCPLAGACVGLRKVVPYGHCRYAAFDRVFLLYLGFATSSQVAHSAY